MDNNQENKQEVQTSETGKDNIVQMADVGQQPEQKLENEAEVEESEQDQEIYQLEAAQIPSLIFCILNVQSSPITFDKLLNISRATKEELTKALEDLKVKLETCGLGVELIEVANGYQIRTKLEFAPFLRQLKTQRPKRLSNQALETLAIIAYRQPIVRSDIEMIRGVDAGPTLKTLIDRKLIRIVGHQQTVGQPALYGTTTDFLEVFGLKKLTDLPTLRDLEFMEEEGESAEADSTSTSLTGDLATSSN